MIHMEMLDEPGDGRCESEGFQMTHQVIEVPADCETVTFTDRNIQRGARCVTRCCGQVIAETTEPVTVRATCCHCGRQWVVTREPAS